MTAVLVAGCGYVGSVLAARLVASGREVWGLRRSVAALPAGVRPIVAAIDEADLGPEALDVCYLVSPDGHDEAAYRRAYLDGLRALAGRVRRLVFASSTAVYDGTAGWVDEQTPCAPASFSGRVLLEAEALAREIAETAVVVRLGGIYGPGRDRTIRSVEGGVAIAIEGERRYGNRIHRDDAAGVFAHLLDAGEGCYAAVDDDPADLAIVQAWLCERLRLDATQLAPAPPSRRGGDRRVQNARLRQSGYDFVYPTFREGYDSLLVGLR
jgi:nucleoside-diphosphate-sugar epimerase